MKGFTEPISKKPVKYHFTPEQDTEIFRVYRELQHTEKRAWIKELAIRFNIPAWKISRRARLIGAYEPRIKEPVWSDRELHILELNALYSCEVIQRKLKMQGFRRSISGINLKRKRLHLRQQATPCSAQAVADCFGIDVHTVLAWIRKGWLRASNKGTHRHGPQGGDEWIIKEKDIKAFITENIGIIDLRKVDKFWFVGILTETSLSIQNSSGDGEDYGELRSVAL